MSIEEKIIECKSCGKSLPNWCYGYCALCYDAMPITCKFCSSKVADKHSVKCTMYVNEEGKEVKRALPNIHRE